VFTSCLNALTPRESKPSRRRRWPSSSTELRADQKDLGYFGEFGVRGVGYYVDDLRDHITKILGLDSPHRVGIVGAGRWAPRSQTTTALVSQTSRSSRCLITIDKRLVAGLATRRLLCTTSTRCKRDSRRSDRRDGDRVPAKAAQRVLNQVMSADQSGAELCARLVDARRGVKVKTVDLTTSLESLSYFLSQPSNSSSHATATEERPETKHG
jgi:redox-sensing transcriptional repressor